MITIEVNHKEKTFTMQGEKYPCTKHNLIVWREYQKSKDESVLDRMSKVVLHLG